MSFFDTFIRVFLAVLLYPGAIFLFVAGLLAESLRRKFVARAEGRQGPPLLQPFYDLRKYFRRVTVVPIASKLSAAQRELKVNFNRAAILFLPLAGIVAVILAAVLLPLPGNFWPFLNQSPNAAQPLGLDLIGVILLLQITTIVTILLGTLAASVYAQVAASRTAQLAVAYLIPYCVAVFGPALAASTLDLKEIATNNAPTMLAVKFGCGLIFVLCQPAQLRTRPLNAATAETLEGVTTNISGTPLALFHLMGWIERLVAALLFSLLFVPFSSSNLLVLIGGILFDLGLIAVLETLFSQVRLKDAFNFYLRYASIGAALWFVVLILLVRA